MRRKRSSKAQMKYACEVTQERHNFFVPSRVGSRRQHSCSTGRTNLFFDLCCRKHAKTQGRSRSKGLFPAATKESTYGNSLHLSHPCSPCPHHRTSAQLCSCHRCNGTPSLSTFSYLQRQQCKQSLGFFQSTQEKHYTTLLNLLGHPQTNCSLNHTYPCQAGPEQNHHCSLN